METNSEIEAIGTLRYPLPPPFLCPPPPTFKNDATGFIYFDYFGNILLVIFTRNFRYQNFFLVSDIKFDIRNLNKTAPHTRSYTRINYVRDNNKFGDPILRLRE